MAEEETPPDAPPTLPEVKNMLLGVQVRAEMAIENAEEGATTASVNLGDLHTAVWVIETTVNLLNAIFMIAIREYGATSIIDEDEAPEQSAPVDADAQARDVGERFVRLRELPFETPRPMLMPGPTPS